MNQRLVYVVDDDASVREGLQLLLEVAGFAVQTFDSAESFLAQPLAQQACVVLDMRMSGLGGQGVLEALKARKTALRVIVLTGHGDIPMTVRAMQSGAADFLTKPVDAPALLQRIESLFQAMQGDAADLAERELWVAAVASLTPREREVLLRSLQGLDAKQTGRALNISFRTVEVHRSHIIRKMRVVSFIDIFRACMRFGLRLD